MAQIRKTLLIGLGGTGQAALTFVKGRMKMAYGDDLPGAISFLSWDLAPAEDATQAMLRHDEFKHWAVNDGAAYVDDHRELDEWLDVDNIDRTKFKNMDQGAQQIRQIGRLSLRWSLPQMLASVKTSMDMINSKEVASDPRWAVSNVKPQVVFFSSIAGGTGGGMLLDIASAIRAQYPNTHHMAYLMMPEVFRDLYHCDYVEENSFAFLRELDFFMAQDNAIRKGEWGTMFASAPPQVTAFNYAFPFDDIVLFDKVSMDGSVNLGGQKALAEAIGRAIYATLGGPAGNTAQTAEVNPGNFNHPWEGGKQCWYSTLGIVELRYPADEFAYCVEQTFLSQLLDLMNTGDSVEQGKQAQTPLALKDDFIQQHRLSELGDDKNDIIDMILPVAAYVPNVPSQLTKEYGPDLIWAQNKEALKARLGQRSTIAADNRESLVLNIKRAFDSELDKLVREGSGTSVAEGFVDLLKGYFGKIRSEMATENADASEKADRYKKVADGFKSSCVSAAGKAWGRKAAVTKVLSSYAEALSSAAKAQDDETRTREAVLFCDALIKYLDETTDVHKGLKPMLSHLTEKTSAELTGAQIALSQGSMSERTIVPDITSVGYEPPSVARFYAWFKEEKGHATALEFWKLTTKECLAYLYEYAHEKLQVAKAAHDQSLADVIGTLDDEARTALLKELDMFAQPLMNVLDHKINDISGGDRPEIIYIVAAHKEFFDAFIDPDTRKDTLEQKLIALSSSQSIAEKEVLDRNRAYFYRKYGAVPAYALSGFEDLKSEYTEHTTKQGAWSLHLDKRWAEVLPNLSSATNIDEKLWIWALAVSDLPDYQRVSRAVNQYTFKDFCRRTDGVADPKSHLLGNGRSAARAAFFARADWVAQCEEAFMATIGRKGKDHSSAEIQGYMDRLQTQRDGATDLIELFQEELDAVGLLVKKIQGKES